MFSKKTHKKYIIVIGIPTNECNELLCYTNLKITPKATIQISARATKVRGQ